MSGVHELFIDGVGFWASRMPGWELARRVLRGESPAPSLPTSRPAPTLLPPAERRRAPDTVAVALEVAASACVSARRSPQTLPSVFASTHGDLAISDSICETLAKTPALTSPTKFHNSVHNAAAGYWTIGTGCMEPYTALSAYTCSFAAGFLEAAVQAQTGSTPVLYVAYDIEARGPAATMQPSRGVLGVGLVLSPAVSERCMTRVRWEVRSDSDLRTSVSRPQNSALVEGNAMAECLALFEALADGVPREIDQSLGPSLSLHICLEPA